VTHSRSPTASIQKRRRSDGSEEGQEVEEAICEVYEEEVCREVAKEVRFWIPECEQAAPKDGARRLLAVRDISERIRDWRWWGEQVAHSVAGGAVSSMLCAFGLIDGANVPVLCMLGVLAGAGAGATYEILQNRNDDANDIVDSHIDSFAFTLGATISSLSWAALL
jgi:hypothetical protein